MIELLVTLLVYLVVGAVVYFFVMEILKTVNATPTMFRAAKLIMLFIALLILLALFFGVPYPAPRIHWKN